VSEVTVDSHGFVYVGKVRIGRYDPVNDTLNFLDRNRWRCTQQGGKEVSIPLESLTGLRVLAEMIVIAESIDNKTK
jgi:hypothetical protein